MFLLTCNEMNVFLFFYQVQLQYSSKNYVPKIFFERPLAFVLL